MASVPRRGWKRACERAEESRASAEEGGGESAHDEIERARLRAHPRAGDKARRVQSSAATSRRLPLGRFNLLRFKRKNTRKTGAHGNGHCSKFPP